MQDSDEESMQPKRDFEHLNWFEFETRMRNQVSKVMEPALSQSQEDRDKVTRMNKIIEDHMKRIQDLEIAIFKTDKVSNAFDQINEKLALMESDRKGDIMKLTNDNENTRENVQNLKFTVESYGKQISSFESHIDNMQ